MSTSAAGTTFTLRTPAHIKSCHVTGSWDNYTKRYQMNADAAGPGWWTLTVKFGSSMPPARYWYYYILDGYFESHDPNKPNCNEPTRKLTLNILDHEISSPTSTRRSSPASSVSSRSSKRSGGVYDIPNPAEYYPSQTRRTPSPTRQHRQLTHIVHPVPRNPMAAHKLTLDTQYNYGRPDSMISSAATTASPLSDRSSSSCSGSTLSSRGSSPATPMCQCDEYEVDTRGHYCEEYDNHYGYDEEYQYAMAPPAKKGGLDENLAYRLERMAM
ncbi:hypothetical protein BDD12DRAFT_884143 [Trichophaea hybrida]|jgi:hypothetical protein|nr:hypothetical protein BDD12DRAFT_884143 [Trichophaea hybrida]